MYSYDPGSDRFGGKNQSNFSYANVFGATPIVAIQGKQLSILGGFSTANWSTSDPANNPTILDGGGSHRGIMYVGQPNLPAGLTLDGLTIQNTLGQGLSNRT